MKFLKWNKSRPIRIGANVDIDLGEFNLFIYLIKAELWFVVDYEHIWYRLKSVGKRVFIIPFIVGFIAMVLLNIPNEPVDAYECVVDGESYYVGKPEHCPTHLSTTTLTTTTLGNTYATLNWSNDTTIKTDYFAKGSCYPSNCWCSTNWTCDKCPNCTRAYAIMCYCPPKPIPTTTTIKTFCSDKQSGWYCIDDTRQECINGSMGATKDCYYIGILNNKYPKKKVRGECRESQGYGKAECYKK